MSSAKDIPTIIPWRVPGTKQMKKEHPEMVQQHRLMLDMLKEKEHSTVFRLLELYTDKKDKHWLKHMKRALFLFKPPEFAVSVWSPFYELFKANADSVTQLEAR